MASRLDIRKYLKSLPWNVLPKEVVTAPSLPEFKKDLDNAFRHMV